MGAALLEHHAMGRVEVRSAGSTPGNEVNPMAVAALEEWGIDIADRTPSVLSTNEVRASDVVITMGCGDACPVFPGKRYLDWDLTDPAGRDLTVVRDVRDDIDRRVRGLLAEILD
jgi:protein-tyrosine-phosphatase